MRLTTSRLKIIYSHQNLDFTPQNPDLTTAHSFAAEPSECRPRLAGNRPANPWTRSLQSPQIGLACGTAGGHGRPPRSPSGQACNGNVTAALQSVVYLAQHRRRGSILRSRDVCTRELLSPTCAHFMAIVEQRQESTGAKSGAQQTTADESESESAGSEGGGPRRSL